jgi:hypothetical protein
MLEPTKLKAWFALEPSVVIAAMHTTIISDNITAYSTAVGPSSFFKNDTKLFVKLRMGFSKVVKSACKRQLGMGVGQATGGVLLVCFNFFEKTRRKEFQQVCGIILRGWFDSSGIPTGRSESSQNVLS